MIYLMDRVEALAGLERLRDEGAPRRRGFAGRRRRALPGDGVPSRTPMARPQTFVCSAYITYMI